MKFLVMAGTEDGRQLAEGLTKRGHDVLVSTLTAYGADLAAQQGLATRYGAMDEQTLRLLLRDGSFNALVDATHPYAVVVKEMTQKVCRELKLPYLRWERSALEFENNPLLHWAGDIPEAARLAAGLGRRILLTTGSNSLAEWLAQPGINSESLYIRVLPTSQVLARCESLGFSPKQIIAAQGPFSQAWDEAMFKQLKIEVVIGKESGKVGGTLEKVQACLSLNIPLILLKRPASESLNGSELQMIETHSIQDFIKKMEELL